MGAPPLPKCCFSAAPPPCLLIHRDIARVCVSSALLCAPGRATRRRAGQICRDNYPPPPARPGPAGPNLRNSACARGPRRKLACGPGPVISGRPASALINWRLG